MKRKKEMKFNVLLVSLSIAALILSMFWNSLAEWNYFLTEDEMVGKMEACIYWKFLIIALITLFFVFLFFSLEFIKIRKREEEKEK